MQIKFLVSQGMKKSRVAERLGISRQTVYNHLDRDRPFPKPREARSSKLDPFKSHIRTRLEAFDLPAAVLFKEIRALGYRGGLTVLQDFVRPLKRELIRRVTERFETLPGQQAQIDWGECGMIDVGGERKKLFVFVMVLGFSRMMYAHFTTSSKLPVLLGCLMRAFGGLGIPAEILVDNMKQAVDRHDVTTGTVRWNARFLDFAEHHGFLPVACPPYWPRVKGKVERGVGYIKSSFLEGRTFTDVEDLNRQLEVWLENVANVRVHGTTGERPVDRHARELMQLRPLAAVPRYDTRSLEMRRAAPDCHFSFRGVLYSVPPDVAGETVTLRLESEHVGAALAVYWREQLVATHTLMPRGSPRVTLPEHAAAIRRFTRNKARLAARRPGRQPRFVQAPGPEVEVRTLDAYERIALESAA